MNLLSPILSPQLELFRTGKQEFREIIFQEMEAWLADFVLSFKIKVLEFLEEKWQELLVGIFELNSHCFFLWTNLEI